MARLPIYEQQTSAKTGRVTPQEMGAGTGQALGQRGSVVADIGLNMKRREDTLDRVRQTRRRAKTTEQLGSKRRHAGRHGTVDHLRFLVSAPPEQLIASGD